MTRKRLTRSTTLRAAAAMSASGLLLASSCSIGDVSRIVAGVQAVVRVADDPSTSDLVDLGISLVAELID